MNTIKVMFTDLPRESALSYCRQLLKEGIDPDTRLEVYREGKTEWDLAIPNIGIGAKYSVQESPKLTLRPFKEISTGLQVEDPIKTSE